MRRRTLCLSAATALVSLAFVAAGNLAAQTPVGAATSAPAATTAPAVAAPAAAATTQSFAEAIQQPQTPPDPLEEFIRKSKHPTKWFAWGADQRIRDEILENGRNSLPGHESHYQSYRTRINMTITPFEDFDINARVMWQPRYYAEPTTRVPRMDKSEAQFDILNVDWRKVLGLPLELKVGRQEITDLDNAWLVYTGTPDVTRSIFFDAARATYSAPEAQTTFDLIGICDDVDGDKWMPGAFNDEEKNQLAEQDESGAIFWVKNKSIQHSQVEGYFIYKHDERVEVPTGDNGDIYTFGARDTTDFTKNWQGFGEIAKQFGEKNGEALSSMAAQARLSYFFHDRMDNQLHADYEFLSGDDPGTSRNEGFDILWGRWARWSELYPFIVQANEGGRYANLTNYHRLEPIGWTCHPVKPMELVADYNLLWADENSNRGNAGFSNSGSFRGQLARFIVRYNFTEHIKTHVTGEMFVPGDYYAAPNNDTAFYLRYEVFFVW